MANQHCSVGPITNTKEFNQVYHYLENKQLIFQNPADYPDLPCYIFIGNVSFIYQKKPSRKTITITELLQNKITIRKKLILNNGMPKDVIPILDR